MGALRMVMDNLQQIMQQKMAAERQREMFLMQQQEAMRKEALQQQRWEQEFNAQQQWRADQLAEKEAARRDIDEQKAAQRQIAENELKLTAENRVRNNNTQWLRQFNDETIDSIQEIMLSNSIDITDPELQSKVMTQWRSMPQNQMATSQPMGEPIQMASPEQRRNYGSQAIAGTPRLGRQYTIQPTEIVTKPMTTKTEQTRRDKQKQVASSTINKLLALPADKQLTLGAMREYLENEYRVATNEEPPSDWVDNFVNAAANNPALQSRLAYQEAQTELVKERTVTEQTKQEKNIAQTQKAQQPSGRSSGSGRGRPKSGKPSNTPNTQIQISGDPMIDKDINQANKGTSKKPAPAGAVEAAKRFDETRKREGDIAARKEYYARKFGKRAPQQQKPQGKKIF